MEKVRDDVSTLKRAIAIAAEAFQSSKWHLGGKPSFLASFAELQVTSTTGRYGRATFSTAPSWVFRIGHYAILFWGGPVWTFEARSSSARLHVLTSTLLERRPRLNTIMQAYLANCPRVVAELA